MSVALGMKLRAREGEMEERNCGMSELPNADEDVDTKRKEKTHRRSIKANEEIETELNEETHTSDIKGRHWCQGRQEKAKRSAAGRCVLQWGPMSFVLFALLGILHIWQVGGRTPDECATRLAESEELVQQQRAEIAELQEEVRTLRAALRTAAAVPRSLSDEASLATSSTTETTTTLESATIEETNLATNSTTETTAAPTPASTPAPAPTPAPTPALTPVPASCNQAIDLSTVFSPYSGSTSGKPNTIDPTCGGSGTEQIFFTDVPPGYLINIGMPDTSYDSLHETRWGGACPGTHIVACTDDPDSKRHQWANSQLSSQRIYFMVDAFSSGSGSFTLTWDIRDTEQVAPCEAEHHIQNRGDLKLLAASNCSVLGGLQIEGDVVDLHPLAGLREVQRGITFKGASLVSLEGLGNLTSVGGALDIRYNDALTSLQGLDSLTSVGGALYIRSNGALTSLQGLDSLTSVGGALDIGYNYALTSLPGLDSLTSVGGALVIRYNNALTSLQGLDSLTSVGGALDIWSNYALTSLQGLDSLTSVGGALDIWGNDALTSLQGLDSLTSVGGALDIRFNDALTSLQGLDSLTSVGGALDIRSNDALTSLQGLDSLTSVGGALDIWSNGALTSLQGLDSLATVFRDVLVSGCNNLFSFHGLGSLASVGGLIVHENEQLTSFEGLDSLTEVWGPIEIFENPSLQSLQGLDRISRAADVKILRNGQMAFLANPFTTDAAIRSLEVDAQSWPLCVTPQEGAALASRIGSSAKRFPGASFRTWLNNSCGPDLVNCTRGRPCNVSLAGANMTGGGSIFLSGRYTSCGVCADVRMQANVTGTAAFFGTRHWNEEGGAYSLCRCDSDKAPLGPVAQMMLLGPRRKLTPVECVRGTACPAEVDGEGLDAGKMLVASECGQKTEAVIYGTLNGTHFLADPAQTSEAPPGGYKLCWGPWCDSAVDGLCCPDPPCEYFEAGDFQLRGAFTRDFPEVVVLSDGSSWTVPNVGLQMSEFDRMRILRTCGQPNGDGFPIIEAVSGPGMIFDFGALTTSRVLPSDYRKCWCSKRAGCDDYTQFLVDTGSVQFLCPPAQESSGSKMCRKCPAGKSKAVASRRPCDNCVEGTFAAEEGWERCSPCPDRTVAQAPGSVQCSACPFGMSPADAKTCSVDPGKIAAFVSYLACIFIATAVLALAVKRPMKVSDVSLIEGRTIVTLVRSHRLHMYGRKHFPVQLRDTRHPDLDSPKAPYLAKVCGSDSLELLRSQGEQLNERLDTSRGTITLAFPHGSWHKGWPVPSPISAFVLLSVALVVAITSVESDVESDVEPERMTLALAVGAPASFVVALMTSLAWRRWQVASPLDLCLADFSQRVAKQQARRLGQQPGSCPKGAGRALRVGKLHELLEAFHEFIRDRTAYYLDGNVIRPLTQAYNISYAEFVGAEEVEWFVSHFWGTAFAHFCQSLRKHAELVCGDRDWTAVRYWVCFCSNNQFSIEEELGTSWQESSFYVTLRSGRCNGTCMVLDDQALPLTRSWCIFELLQTVNLQQSQPGFGGLTLCTASGVLNSGGGSVEVAMALAERVAAMNLEQAQASSQKDRTMINEQVVKDLGSFDALNHFIREAVSRILETAKGHTISKFADVFRKLQNDGAVHV